MVDGILGSIEFINSKKLRALGVSTLTRSPVLPDVPTVNEFVPGYEATGWFGIGAPRGTPRAIVETLNKEINAGLENPLIKARLEGLGGRIFGGSPSDFATFIANETEKWGKVVKFAKLSPI